MKNRTIVERTARGGAGFLAANVISKLASFAFVITASFLLGPTQFGLLALGLSVITLAESIALFGLPTAVQKFVAGECDDVVQRILGAILVMTLLVAVLGSIAVYYFAEVIADSIFHEPALVGPLEVLAVGMFFSMVYGVMRAVLQAQEHVGRIVIADAMQQFVKIVLCVVFFNFFHTVNAIAWAVVCSFAVAGLFAIGFIKASGVKAAFTGVWVEMRSITSYAAPTFLIGFSYLIAQQADRVMLGSLAGVESVGVYTLASTLALIMSVMHTSLVSVFMPIASEAHRNGRSEDIRESYNFISKWLGNAGALLLLFFFGFGLTLLGISGAEFASPEAYVCLVLLAGLYFLGTWTGPTGALLLMADGQKSELLNTVVFLTVNIALNYWLIPVYGIIGAAIATFSSALLRKSIQVIQIWKRYGFIVFDQQRVRVLLVVVATISFGVMFEVGSVGRLSAVLIGMCATSWFAVRMVDAGERVLLAGIAAKIKGKAKLVSS